VQFKIGTAEIKKYRQYYLIFVFIATTAIATIPLAAGNFGYDYTTSLQTCIYLFGDNQAFFWLTLVLPFSVMLFTSFIFSILTFKRLHHIFVESQLRHNNKANTQVNRLPSDVNSAQDEYTQRMRFNYWSSDELDNDFDSDGKVTIKSTIANPLSCDVELSLSGRTGHAEQYHHYADKERNYSSDSTSPSFSLSQHDRSVHEELAEARRSGSVLSSSGVTHEASLASSGASASVRGGGAGSGNVLRGEYMERPSSIGTRSSSVIERGEAGTEDITKSSSKLSNIWICINKTWKYNGRMILFLFFFCAVAIFLLPTLIYLFYTKYDQFVHGTENFVACLVRVSLTTPASLQTQQTVDARAHSECGSHPSNRPPFYVVSKQSERDRCY
jgi:hypothetical protein